MHCRQILYQLSYQGSPSGSPSPWIIAKEDPGLAANLTYEALISLNLIKNNER